MKSTKNSLVTLIVLGIVIASLSIGTIAVASFRNVAEENNHEILLHYCKESTELLNGRLAQIEGLVDTLSECCAHRAGSAAKLQDSAFLEACVEEVGQVAYYITQNNDAIVTAYFRVDPAIAGPRAGFFISRNSAAEKPEFLEPTDLSAFNPSDVQNVGWYYIPVEAGQAVWLDPYVNPRNGVLTISYAKPLYLDGVLAGVVGIDLDFGVISKAVDEVSLFDSGFAVLMDSRGLAYTGTRELAIPASAADQITSEQDEYLFSQFLERQQLYVTASHKVDNGMHLALIVPEAELYSTRNQLTFTVFLVAIAVSALVILVLTGMVNRVISVSRTDGLTGARNRNAFLERSEEVDSAMRSGKRPTFAILVFDINGLKAVNDTAGHAAGDKLIVSSYREIAERFPDEEIYRIGGDEFAVFIEKRTAAIAEKIAEDFREAMERKVREGGQSFDEGFISCGCALYNPQTDASCEDTFSRADKSMYEDKQRFYAENPQLKRRS